MTETRFMYKGIEVIVQDDHPNGTVIVGKRKFKVSHHHAESGLSMWACDEAYFMSPDLKELAKHFVDYGYMFDAPGRVIVPGGHDSSGHDHANPGRKRVTTTKAKKTSRRKATQGG